MRKCRPDHNRSYPKLAWSEKNGQVCEQRLKKLEEEGPIIHGGREPYRLWGYLRHRHIYFCGQPARALESEENRRRSELRRQAEQLKQWHREAEEYRLMTGN